MVIMTGRRPQRSSASCQQTGTVEETLRFTYMERVTPQSGGHEEVPVPPPADRQTLSERTRNFLAITFYPHANGSITLLPYFERFPGLDASGGLRDSGGGLIPALTTDEGGVALSWVWLRKRALYTSDLVITPRTVAHSMAGVEPSACDAQVHPTSAGTAAAGSESRAAALCKDRSRVSERLCRLWKRSQLRHGLFQTPSGHRRVDQPPRSRHRVELDADHVQPRVGASGRDRAADFRTRLGIRADYIALFYDGDASTLKPVAYYSDPGNFDHPNCRPLSAGGPERTLAPAKRESLQPADLTGQHQAVARLGSRVEQLEERLSRSTETGETQGQGRSNSMQPPPQED